MYINELLRTLVRGTQSANRYISEDLEAICDDTMREYAESALEDLNQGLDATKELTAALNKQELYQDVLTDISSHVAYQQIKFEDVKERNTTLRSWTQNFVDKYGDTDWTKVDYNILVGEYAVEKVNDYRKFHQQEEKEKPYKISFVLGTEAVNEYAEAVDSGKKWSVSSLCDCGAVAHGSFATQEELDAYKQGIEDATGWLESERMMTDKEWKEYLDEYFNDEDDE